MPGFDPQEFGRVLARLDAQDRQIVELRNDVRSLLDLANKGRGSLLTLIAIGSLIGTVIGWFAGKWFH